MGRLGLRALLSIGGLTAAAGFSNSGATKRYVAATLLVPGGTLKASREWREEALQSVTQFLFSVTAIRCFVQECNSTDRNLL